MKFLINVNIFLVIIFTGCENITDLDQEFNFKEYVVVQAELVAGKEFEGVRFTKTLPVGEDYDITKAELKNVVCHLKVNGVQVIPLHYTAEGIYKPRYDYEITAGNIYELFAEIEEKAIYSKTFVPQSPFVSQPVFNNEGYLSAKVKVRPEEAYGAIWIVGSNNPAASADDLFSVVKSSSALADSSITIRTKKIAAPYDSSIYRNSLHLKVFSFDIAYSKFFETKNNNQSIDDTFTQGGGNVSWNVYGEDVIGLFIGTAESGFIKPNL